MLKDAKPVSRRGLFSLALTAAGGIGMLLASARAAAAKMTQQASGYQATPKGDQSCATCSLFSAPATCSLVGGDVSPQGWCRLYQKKS
jgi:hypothetical protein